MKSDLRLSFGLTGVAAIFVGLVAAQTAVVEGF